MAATILNVGSKFNPLSFDEMVKPYLMYKQEADKTEAAINDYTEKGDVIGSLIDPNRDTEASALYNQFNEAAQSAITNFYNNGYTPDVKKSLLNLRKNYATNMSKIQAAYTAREKERTMQNELKAKDPTIMFSRDANYESLDSYLMGEPPTYKLVSGDYLYKLGLQAGKSASTRQDLTIEARKALENTYWELKQNQGFTDSQALEYMKNTNPMFNSIVSNIRNGSNIDSLNPNDQERANSAILNGVLSGLVGEQKVDYKPVINVNVNTGGNGGPEYSPIDYSKFNRVSVGSTMNEDSRRNLKEKEFSGTLTSTPDGRITNSTIETQEARFQGDLERMKEIEEILGGTPYMKVTDSGSNDGRVIKDYYIGDKKTINNKEISLIKEYSKLQDKTLDLRREIGQINNLKDKYSGLSSNGDLESIQIGSNIAYNQSITDNSIIGFDTATEAERNNILSNINDRLKKMPINGNAENIESATTGMFIDEGEGFKPVDSDLFEKYLKGSDGTIDISKFSLGASFNNLKNGNALVLTAPISDGKRVKNIALTWKGDIDSDHSRILKTSDDFVKVYDNSIKVNSIMNGVSGEELASALLISPSKIDIGEGVNLGSGLIGHTIRTGDGDIVKVVTRGYGDNKEIIQISTMYDEYGKGSTEGTYRASTMTESLLNLLGYTKNSIKK